MTIFFLSVIQPSAHFDQQPCAPNCLLYSVFYTSCSFIYRRVESCSEAGKYTTAENQVANEICEDHIPKGVRLGNIPCAEKGQVDITQEMCLKPQLEVHQQQQTRQGTPHNIVVTSDQEIDATPSVSVMGSDKLGIIESHVEDLRTDSFLRSTPCVNDSSTDPCRTESLPQHKSGSSKDNAASISSVAASDRASVAQPGTFDEPRDKNCHQVLRVSLAMRVKE